MAQQIGETGSHERLSYCLVFIGPQDYCVPINWAMEMLELATPVNAFRVVGAIADADPGRARVSAVQRGLSVCEWAVVVPVGERLRWDAVDKVMRDGQSCRVGGALFVKASEVISPLGEVRSKPLPERPDLALVGQEFVDVAALYGAPEQAERPTLDIQSTSVALCIPSLGVATLRWLTGAVSLYWPIGVHRRAYFVVGHEVAQARQMLVDAVLAANPRPEYLLFLGDDMICHPEAVARLFERQRIAGGAVSGLYYMKKPDRRVPLVWQPTLEAADFKVGDVFEAAGCGLDFALIPAEELAQLRAADPVLFKTAADEDGVSRFVHTEDAYFWGRYKAMFGRGPIIDTNILVGHLDHRTGVIHGWDDAPEEVVRMGIIPLRERAGK